MSVNDPNHEYCSRCGKKLEFQKSEKDGEKTLLFYACPETLTEKGANHDRAVYEVSDRHD